MLLIDRLRARRIRAVAQMTYPDWLLATAGAQKWAMPDYTLATNQAKAYEAISWINTALQVVGNMCGLQKLNVYALEGEKRIEQDNHPLESLLQNPNPNMSRFELLYGTIAYRKLCGTAYWWLNRSDSDAEPDEIWLVPTNRLKPVPDEQMYIKGYIYDPGDGQFQTLPPWQIISFKNFHPRNEFVGLSDIEAIAITAEGDQKMAKWNTNFFAEDHAKFPGVLAFEQHIADPAWERIKEEFKEAHGGTRRSLRMMRGVGAGGIHWIQTTISQKDMEFLEGRKFNQEEIFGVIAPGLASMLAINATEANSLTGRKTVTDMVVWPNLVSIAEKIGAQLLPVYGDNLVCEFDDPRIVDRAMQLSEEDAYARVHTVDELREKYYEDKPLGGDKGTMLAAEVGKGQMGFGAVPESSQPEQEQDEEEKEVKARMGELNKWRRYATKRMGPDAAKFRPDYLPEDLTAIIRNRLKAATSREEVVAAFAGPF